MKQSPALITLHIKKEDAKAFNDAIKAKGAVFVEKTATKDGFNISYTVPTACKEAVVALLKKSGFSMTEAKKAYPGLFPAAPKKEAKGDDDEEDDDEDEDEEDDLEEDSPISDPEYNGDIDNGDDPEGLKGAGEGSKDWKSQVFSGEAPLPTPAKRSTKNDSFVVKAAQTFRIPGTNQIVTEGESIRIYPKKK